MAVSDVTDKDFQSSVLDAQGLVLVDMWAPWCGPCRILSPILDELSGKYPNVTFTKLNVDENPETQSKYQIIGIPSVLFVKDGVVLETVIGVQPKDRYVQLIEKQK